MSAIWGRINRDAKVEETTALCMKNAMINYKIDRIEEILQDNTYFACGHQYITNEAVNDISPVYHPDKHIYFTADCFLYNRDDVISKIEHQPDYQKIVKDKVLSSCGDAELSYYAFLVLGFSFVKALRGSFAFAIFESDCNKLHLLTDHMAKRYLAYYLCEDYVCFGSTYKPIKSCLGKSLELNRRFIINSYRDMTPMNFVLPEETPYQNVFHVENGTHLTIDLHTLQIDRESYWNPLKTVKHLKHLSDSAYKELFLNTYEALTIAQLRARKETGIMLSGGLDSSSVAAYAAPYLAKQGKKLFSYTSTPVPEYVSNSASYIIENETELINEQVKRHSNICPHFVTNGDENCITKLEQYQKDYSIPVLPSINNVYIAKMGQTAMENNCSILLSGSNGNATVSYGSIGEYIILSIQKVHFYRAFHEMFVFCIKHNLSRKKYFKCWLKVTLNYLFSNPKEKTYYLKKADINIYHLQHVKKELKKAFGNEYFATERQKYNFMYMPTQYMQKGFYYTTQSLLYGYLNLDPTLTVEMVELCMSFPNECFVQNGIERRMIRDYMKDFIPFPIVDDQKGFGVQAADFAFRVNRDWDKVKDSIYDILQDSHLNEYLDKEKIDELLSTIHDNEHNLDKPTIWDATLIGSLGYFLRDFYADKQ